MQIFSTPGWNDYELLDSGEGYRLERFGKYVLSRPDPQIIWKKKLPEKEWNKADGVFERTTHDKGIWMKKNPQLPDTWLLQYKNLSFWVKLTPFKHTGVFPEQCVQWNFITDVIQKTQNTLYSRKSNNQNIRNSETLNNRFSDLLSFPSIPKQQPNILNLFAYTGISSLAAVSAGAKVTHVDSSKPTIGWARENQTASNLTDKSIRWILDDAMKFTQREINRGVRYEAIIMDPPVFGHGPDGNVWKFNEHFPKLLELCKQVLTDTPLFIIVNAYAISSSAFMLQNVLEDYFADLGGTIEFGELGLQEKQNKRIVSTGIFARWYAK